MPSEIEGALESAVREALGAVRAPGCSIAVVDATGPRWTGAFGLADVRRARPAAADTVYHLFSGTKLFTATAVMQLVEKEQVGLDDPAGRFVPGLGPAADVTVQQLLSHRSGLKDTLRAFLAVTLPGEPPLTSAEALARFQLRPARGAGQRVEYRNVNYAILGELVTRVSGLEYREYVARHVLAPLGIEAAFEITAAMRARRAAGYLERWDPMRLALRLLFPDLPRRLYRERAGALVELGEYTLGSAAIGGLVGSMPELAKFLVAQLSGGGAILSEASTWRMQTLVAEGAAGIASRSGIGLGWKIGRTDAHAFLNHEGGGAGFTSELRIYPEAGIGIALAMNVMRQPRTMWAAHRICEAVLAGREALPAASG